MIQPVAHCDNVEIERLSANELSPADFHTKYFRLAKPVVITGATDQWPARKWTIENLVQRVGDNKVSISQLYLYLRVIEQVSLPWAGTLCAPSRSFYANVTVFFFGIISAIPATF